MPRRIDDDALNYGWGHQPGWTDESELTLVGVVSGSRAAVAAVRMVRDPARVRAARTGARPCRRAPDRAAAVLPTTRSPARLPATSPGAVASRECRFVPAGA